MGMKIGTETKGLDPDNPMVATFAGMVQSGLPRSLPRPRYDLCLRFEGREDGPVGLVDHGMGFVDLNSYVDPSIVDALWVIYNIGKERGFTTGVKAKTAEIKHVLEVG